MHAHLCRSRPFLPSPPAELYASLPDSPLWTPVAELRKEHARSGPDRLLGQVSMQAISQSASDDNPRSSRIYQHYAYHGIILDRPDQQPSRDLRWHQWTTSNDWTEHGILLLGSREYC